MVRDEQNNVKELDTDEIQKWQDGADVYEQTVWENHGANKRLEGNS